MGVEIYDYLDKNWSHNYWNKKYAPIVLFNNFLTENLGLLRVAIMRSD